MKKETLIVTTIIATALLVRVYDFSFPVFTSDEARIAYRGYTLASGGKDELGRFFPFLFNSLSDYQLPTVSYITAAGILLFGKTDFGARLPFLLISLLNIILIYKISKVFNLSEEFRILSVFIATFSPVFIFLSKIPNEATVLTFSLLLLFYLLTSQQINFIWVGLTMVLALSISKMTWWVLVPFTGVTLISFQKSLSKRTKMIVLIIALVLTAGAISLFLQVPQASRSLLENDFPIFREASIRVAADRLRGQGLEAGWPQFLEKILFNRFQFIFAGAFNWLHNLQPAILFGQFDETGTSFVGMGAFPKIAVLSFVVGLIFMIRKRVSSLKLAILYPILLTFPIFFLYPNTNRGFIVISLPLLIFIIAFGMTKLNRFLKFLTLALLIFEIFINIAYLKPDIKIASSIRPAWIKGLIADSYSLSLNDGVAISDDLVSDLVPLLSWYASLPIREDFGDIQFPYKFHQMSVFNTSNKIRLIGSDDSFYFCGLDKPTYVFASSRDLAKIKKWLNIVTEDTVTKIYEDDLGGRVAYLLRPTICVH